MYVTPLILEARLVVRDLEFLMDENLAFGEASQLLLQVLSLSGAADQSHTKYQLFDAAGTLVHSILMRLK